MNDFYKKLEKTYIKYKDVPNPPEFVKTIEELLELQKSKN